MIVSEDERTFKRRIHATVLVDFAGAELRSVSTVTPGDRRQTGRHKALSRLGSTKIGKTIDPCLFGVPFTHRELTGLNPFFHTVAVWCLPSGLPYMEVAEVDGSSAG